MTSIDPVQVGREAAALEYEKEGRGINAPNILKGELDMNYSVKFAIAGATEMLARMGGAEGRGDLDSLRDLMLHAAMRASVGQECRVTADDFRAVARELLELAILRAQGKQNGQ